MSLGQIFASFAINIAAMLFAAICTALGFGPDRWAAFLVAGMPFLITPGALRLAFLLSASLTLFAAYWRPITAFSSTLSYTKSVSLRAVTVLVFCLPFVVGAFYVNVKEVERTAESISTGIVAAGTTQETATPLTARYNVVSTVPRGAGVRLYVLAPGETAKVANEGQGILPVYPAYGVSIGTLRANAPINVGVGTTAVFEGRTATEVGLIP
jgi:hypothetical protein